MLLFALPVHALCLLCKHLALPGLLSLPAHSSCCPCGLACPVVAGATQLESIYLPACNIRRSCSAVGLLCGHEMHLGSQSTMPRACTRWGPRPAPPMSTGVDGGAALCWKLQPVMHHGWGSRSGGNGGSQVQHRAGPRLWEPAARCRPGMIANADEDFAPPSASIRSDTLYCTRPLHR